MVRKCVSISLAVSFIALGSSGLLMIILDSFSFQLQMHPVHKIFGVLMVVAGCLHLYLNMRPITAYLKNKKIVSLALLLLLVLLCLFFVGVNKQLDPTDVERIEQLMRQVAVLP